jgi:penicillin-binding protein 2
MISPPAEERRRPVRLPRSLPGRRAIPEPISSAYAGFFGGAGFYLRVGMLAAVALFAFGILGLRLWSLQVLQGPRYTHLAQRQTFRYVDLPAPRAPIVDAKGRTLAGTSGRLVLTADAESLGSDTEHGGWVPTRHGLRLLARVASLAQTDVATLVERIRHSRVRSPYAPAVVLPHLKRGLADFLDERAVAFPGLHVAALPVRSYPQGALGSEFLGLLGEINEDQLKERKFRGARPGEVIGQSGVEWQYDRLLNGGLERDRVAVDSLGRAVGPLRPLKRSVPRRGLALTIDASLQRTAELAIRHGIAAAHVAGHAAARNGAAVVMNAHTGGLLALASWPSFNQVAAADSPEYLARLLNDKSSLPGVFNLATQGLFPTGSTFKPIVAEAALAIGLISPYTGISCMGSYTVGGHTFFNVESNVNAVMSLPEALTVSCDTWFYQVGSMFYRKQAADGSLAMQHWAKLLGLGHTTGLDIPNEAGGVVPTPRWLKATYSGWAANWYEGDSVNLAVGQGRLQVTPLQLAVAYAALANGGTVVRPHVARALVNASGHVLGPLRFQPRAHLRLTDAWAIRDGLYSAAHAPNGTSSAVFAGFQPAVCGKTGTAEAPPGDDHSWYASWAPCNDPQIVVVVVIPHGGFGAEAAAPAAKEIYQAYFSRRGYSTR